MIHRSETVTLSAEEAARYDDDERDNLRSWGIIVSDPLPYDPSEQVPIEPWVIHTTPPGLTMSATFQIFRTASSWARTASSWAPNSGGKGP